MSRFQRCPLAARRRAVIKDVAPLREELEYLAGVALLVAAALARASRLGHGMGPVLLGLYTVDVLVNLWLELAGFGIERVAGRSLARQSGGRRTPAASRVPFPSAGLGKAPDE